LATNPFRTLILTTLLVSALSLQSLIAAETSPPKASLFKRLGGKAKISQIVTKSVDHLGGDSRLMANAKIKDASGHVNRSSLKTQLTNNICQLTGGPCKYVPVKLGKSAQGIKLAPMEWFYVMADVNQSLDEAKVPAREKGELLQLLIAQRN
jgi:hemoglobin